MSDLDEGLMSDTAADTAGSSWGPPSSVGSAGSPLDAVVATAVKGFDAAALVEGVVTAEVTKEVRKIVAAAFTKALTPARRQLLAEAVDAEFKTMTGESAGPAGAEAEEVENHFPNVYVFVQDFLVKVHPRPVRDGLSWHWCSHWWDHPEAVSRLEALWKAFEGLRRDPGTGAATWWRDYADPTIAALSDAGGTFAKCSDTSHAVPPDLPMDQPAPWLLESDGATRGSVATERSESGPSLDPQEDRHLERSVDGNDCG